MTETRMEKKCVNLGAICPYRKYVKGKAFCLAPDLYVKMFCK